MVHRDAQARLGESGRPPRGTFMLLLNAAEELVNQRGTKKGGQRSSTIRLVVYNRPILATLWGARGKAGLRETSWEATAVIYCGITEVSSQARNRLMTNDIRHESLRARGAVDVAQRVRALDTKPPIF